MKVKIRITVEFCSVYHTKSERIWSVSMQMQASYKYHFIGFPFLKTDQMK